MSMRVDIEIRLFEGYCSSHRYTNTKTETVSYFDFLFTICVFFSNLPLQMAMGK